MDNFRIGYTVDGHTKLFEPSLDDVIKSVGNEELQYHLETVRQLSFYLDAGLASMMPEEVTNALAYSERQLVRLAHSVPYSDWGDFHAWRESVLSEQLH